METVLSSAKDLASLGSTVKFLAYFGSIEKTGIPFDKIELSISQLGSGVISRYPDPTPETNSGDV